VVFFSYLEDDGRQYLTRTWLARPDEDAPSGGAPGTKSKRAEWNGLDWFVAFGDDSTRSWEDGRRYAFVSAGGGRWYSRTIRGLPIGARVNVLVPKCGYVAVGVTLAEAKRFDEAEVEIDGQWVPLAEQSLTAPYRHGGPGEPVTDDNAEFVVPVRWLAVHPKEEGYWEKGMFASQNSACKLRQEFTLSRLSQHFGLHGDAWEASAST
jgi:hypothetical protein